MYIIVRVSSSQLVNQRTNEYLWWLLMGLRCWGLFVEGWNDTMREYAIRSSNIIVLVCRKCRTWIVMRFCPRSSFTNRVQSCVKWSSKRRSWWRIFCENISIFIFIFAYRYNTWIYKVTLLIEKRIFCSFLSIKYLILCRSILIICNYDSYERRCKIINLNRGEG